MFVVFPELAQEGQHLSPRQREEERFLLNGFTRLDDDNLIPVVQRQIAFLDECLDGGRLECIQRGYSPADAESGQILSFRQRIVLGIVGKAERRLLHPGGGKVFVYYANILQHNR